MAKPYDLELLILTKGQAGKKKKNELYMLWLSGLHYVFSVTAAIFLSIIIIVTSFSTSAMAHPAVSVHLQAHLWCAEHSDSFAHGLTNASLPGSENVFSHLNHKWILDSPAWSSWM